MGCRERAAKSELLRIVAAGNELVPDPLAQLAGRGAYLHPSQRCWEQAQHRRAFPRALRVPGPLGGQLLTRYLRSGGATEDGNRLGKAGQDSDERPMSTRR
ncbi:MAG TPA: YlxR family protein [Streptosporangiaceae bacterium]